MGGGTKSVTSEAKWFDPLGPTGANVHGPTGGPEKRTGIFNKLDSVRPGVDYARGQVIQNLYGAGGNPGFGLQADLGARTLRGDFLNGGPALDTAVGKMRGQSDREGSNDEADARAKMQRAGVAYSTPSQEAQAGARTARTASANTAEAQMRQAVHGQERGFQMGAGSVLKDGVNAPIDFLSNISKASYAGMGDEGNLVSGLAGNGAYITPNVQLYKQPGAFDYATQAISSL